MKVKQMCYIAISVALISICSWISIPTTIPFTLQTFAVFLTILLLGGKDATIAVGVYLLLGFVGVPVFSGFGAGIAKLIGPTGGFLIGFIIMTLLAWIFQKQIENNRIKTIICLIIGLILCYALGSIWFLTVYINNSKEITLAAILSTCVIPFIIPDLIKMALALCISSRTKKYIKY